MNLISTNSNQKRIPYFSEADTFFYQTYKVLLLDAKPLSVSSESKTRLPGIDFHPLKGGSFHSTNKTFNSPSSKPKIAQSTEKYEWSFCSLIFAIVIK
ncbi:MAG: hypothetical protein LH473_05060 [Chitinophagales bacterium]|nr:hypothetical protein [Chitinophagales bacterium]